MTIEHPTNEQITAAVVAAARLTGEDPVIVIEGGNAPRARAIAYAALLEVFPGCAKRTPAYNLGYFGAHEANDRLAKARKSGWWRDDWLDDVVGALVADRYGAQAS